MVTKPTDVSLTLMENYYIHVRNITTGVQRLVVGPVKWHDSHDEVVILLPQPYIVVSRGFFVRVIKPGGKLAIIEHSPPFPLLPGEEIVPGRMEKTIAVLQDTALWLRAKKSFQEPDIKREASSEWYMQGPCTYYPHYDVTVVETITAVAVSAEQGLLVQDAQGTQSLVKGPAVYLRPSLGVTVVKTVESIVLTDTSALRVTCLKSKKTRVITKNDMAKYLPDPLIETVEGVEVTLVSLTARQYCYVTRGTSTSGTLKKGPKTFYLLPGEALRGGVETNVYTLSADDGLVVTTTTKASVGTVEKTVLIRGPQDYIPPEHATKKVPWLLSTAFTVGNCDLRWHRTSTHMRMEPHAAEVHYDVGSADATETLNYTPLGLAVLELPQVLEISLQVFILPPFNYQKQYGGFVALVPAGGPLDPETMWKCGAIASVCVNDPRSKFRTPAWTGSQLPIHGSFNVTMSRRPDEETSCLVECGEVTTVLRGFPKEFLLAFGCVTSSVRIVSAFQSSVGACSSQRSSRNAPKKRPLEDPKQDSD